jgi:hypothetical protein
MAAFSNTSCATFFPKPNQIHDSSLPHWWPLNRHTLGQVANVVGIREQGEGVWISIAVILFMSDRIDPLAATLNLIGLLVRSLTAAFDHASRNGMSSKSCSVCGLLE